MNRRTTLKSIGAITTHALFPTILSNFLASCAEVPQGKEIKQTPYSPIFFSKKEFEVIKVMIDLILPATQTASATEVGTHQFIDEVFAKCLTKERQGIIKRELSKFIIDFENSNNKNELLVEVDNKAYANDEDYTWFKPIKQFTMVGFFTSEEGTTKASNYVPVPGDYKGEIPLDESTLNYGLTTQKYYI